MSAAHFASSNAATFISRLTRQYRESAAELLGVCPANSGSDVLKAYSDSRRDQRSLGTTLGWVQSMRQVNSPACFYHFTEVPPVLPPETGADKHGAYHAARR